MQEMRNSNRKISLKASLVNLAQGKDEWTWRQSNRNDPNWNTKRKTRERKKQNQKFQKLWGDIKYSKTSIIGIPESQKKENMQKYLKK